MLGKISWAESGIAFFSIFGGAQIHFFIVAFTGLGKGAVVGRTAGAGGFAEAGDCCGEA